MDESQLSLFDAEDPLPPQDVVDDLALPFEGEMPDPELEQVLAALRKLSPKEIARHWGDVIHCYTKTKHFVVPKSLITKEKDRR